MFRKFLSGLLIAAGLVLFIYCGIIAYPHIKGYIDAAKLYHSISDEAVKPSDGKAGPLIFEGGTEDAPEIYGPDTEADTEAGTESEYVDDSIDIDAGKLLKRNSDYIGWIYIPETGISYPVVQSADNSDYLHRSFDKNYLFSGTVFMDSRNKEFGADFRHSILYGHNMRDGSMFAGIKKYQDEKFYKQHDHFWFITPDEKRLYKVIACNLVEPSDKAAFSVEYEDDDDFITQIKDLVSRSLIKTGYEPSADDKIMTLSTCTPDHYTRNVVSGVYIGSIRTKDAAAGR